MRSRFTFINLAFTSLERSVTFWRAAGSMRQGIAGSKFWDELAGGIQADLLEVVLRPRG